MFPTWRLKLREARLALQGGRYDDAGQLLTSSEIREFLPAKQLATEVAGKFVARAQQRMESGDSMAGWRDLSTAARLGGKGDAVDQVKSDYANQAVAEAYRSLAAGDPQTAMQRLYKLQHRGLWGPKERTCRQVAERIDRAHRYAAKGRMAEAASELDCGEALICKPTTGEKGIIEEVARHLRERSKTMSQQKEKIRQLSSQLHAALQAEDWSAALESADALLEIAPQHTTARQARRQAWRAVGMDATQFASPKHHVSKQNYRPVPLVYGNVDRGQRKLQSTHHAARFSDTAVEDDTVTGHETPNRMLMWIDAVGGYLLCMDDHLILGQPTPSFPIALPILADLSRRHAVIRRDGGAYVLEPVQRTYVDGRELTGPTLLSSGQVIQLGDGVRLRFTKPHALSSTARLDIESHHKTQPSADGIVLMADSCVLGPGDHCHVQARKWEHDVILFRGPDGLMCRTGGTLTVDDEPSDGAVAIVPGARVEGEDFSFCIENA